MEVGQQNVLFVLEDTKLRSTSVELLGVQRVREKSVLMSQLNAQTVGAVIW